MKALVLACLLVLTGPVAAGGGALVHFKDAILVASDCPDVTYAVLIEDGRHLGKVSIPSTCAPWTLIPVAGQQPDMPEDHYALTVAVGDSLFFECALLQSYLTQEIRDVVVSCRARIRGARQPTRSR